MPTRALMATFPGFVLWHGLFPALVLAVEAAEPGTHSSALKLSLLLPAGGGRNTALSF